MMDKQLKKQGVLNIAAMLSVVCFGALSAHAQELPSAESLLNELKKPAPAKKSASVKKTSTPKATTSKPAISSPKKEAPKSESIKGLPPTKLAVPTVPSEPAPKKRTIPPAPKAVKVAPKVAPRVSAKPVSAPTSKKVTTPVASKTTPPPSRPNPTQTAPPESQTVLPLRFVQSMFESLHEADRSRYADLTPWMDSELWWQAHDALRNNKCSKGLKLARRALNERYPKRADKPERPREVRYALARFELCGGRAAEGRKTMRALATGKDGVSLLARRALGESVSVRSASTTSKVTRSSTKRVSMSTQVRQFEALSKTNRTSIKAVTASFDALRDSRLSRSQWQRVTHAMATYLERKNQIDDAGLLWLGLYQRTRSRKNASAYERQVVRFERRHKVKLRTLDVHMDEVRRLIVKKKYKQARKLIVKNANMARVKPRELRGWRMYVKAMELERRRKRKDAVKLFAKADKLIKHPVARARLYSGWALALRRTNKDLEAVALYKKLCTEYPGERSLCAEALYQSGRLLQYENKLKEAYDTFFMLAGFYPESKRMSEVIWRAALCAYLLKRYDDMKPLLATIQDRWPRKKDSSGLPIGLKAQYWMGVVAMRQQRVDDASTQFQKTISMGPLTWYGRLAHARLKQMGVSVPDALPMSQLTLQDLNTLEAMRVPKDARLGMAAPLIRTGFYPDAYKEVRRHAYSKHPLAEGKAMLAALKLALGHPDQAHWMARRLISTSGPTANTLRTWATSFPLVHIQHIHKYAQAYKVNPMLVQAIMRQESGFRAKVKSYAGALGLMQLMPGTAKYVARVFLDDTAYRSKHIFTPETNIKLGSMYIRLHVAFASDEVPLALAGYNAGPAPLRRWVKDYGDREMDAWVESITYKQARGYVRKVMTSYIAYSALYNPERMPAISLKMPKTLRKWGVVPGVSAQTVSSLDLNGVSGDALANSMLD